MQPSEYMLSDHTHTHTPLTGGEFPLARSNMFHYKSSISDYFNTVCVSVCESVCVRESECVCVCACAFL